MTLWYKPAKATVPELLSPTEPLAYPYTKEAMAGLQNVFGLRNS